MHLSKILENNEVIIVSGGCRGADVIGENFANKYGLKIERYPAEWQIYGKKAAYIRNNIMAEVCDYAIIFLKKNKDNKGSKMMLQLTKRYNKPTQVIEVE